MIHKSHLMVIVIALPLLIITLALFTVGGRKVSLTQKIEEYLSEGHFDSSNNQLIWNIATGYLQDSPYNGKLIINGSPETDHVNVYILDRDPKKYFVNINCNCAYLGEENIIVCDKKLIENLQRLIEIKSSVFVSSSGEEESYPEVVNFINSRYAYFVRQLLIGHEIGHLILGHGNDNSQGHEMAADKFAVERNSSAGDVFFMWLGLSNVIDAIYTQAMASQNPAYLDTQPAILELAYSTNEHPPLLIRLLDMAQLLVESHPDIDNTGYFLRLRESIRQSENGAKPSNLCSVPSPETIPTHVPPRAEKDGFYELNISTGAQYFKMTKYDWALAEYTAAIEQMIALIENGNSPSPELSKALLARGMIYLIQGNYENALTDFKFASQLEPTNPIPYSNGGFVYYELDQLDQAIDLWSGVTSAYPSYAEAWAGWGIALYAQGKEDDAVNAYKKALEIEPEFSSTNILRYKYYWTEKSIQGASAILELMEP